MATKTIVTKIDDIDGSPAVQSFTFTWQGVRYDIDLSKANAAALKADFDKWISSARRHRFGGRQAGQPTKAQIAEAAAAAAAKPGAKPAAKPATKAAAKPAAKAATKAPAKPAPKTATKTAAKPAAKKTAAKKASGPATSDVRAWAVQEGIKVADRGRLAPALVEKFLAAKAAAAKTEVEEIAARF